MGKDPIVVFWKALYPRVYYVVVQLQAQLQIQTKYLKQENIDSIFSTAAFMLM